MEEKEVWIVDDEKDLASTYARLIEENHPTRVFYSAEAALDAWNQELLAGKTPGVILTDIKMGNMDGVSLVETIRSTGAEIPIILSSAFAERHHLARAIQAKVFAFIEKPAPPSEILKHVDQAIHGPTLNHTKINQALRELVSHYIERCARAENILFEKGLTPYRDSEDRLRYLAENKKENRLWSQLDALQPKKTTHSKHSI